MALITRALRGFGERGVTPKYELIELGQEDGQTFYTVRALRDFGAVKAGDEGGVVNGEHNLSHKGDCWPDEFSSVFGQARLEDNAQ